ncbi:2-amino-4-hydroxy-6-hydroxymethyldihydropteridine diphosphokinase [Candidatus Micrarchaeota archaeon]|nr:2-amino-4-hydroxy-6-hydroxymethyldihydropteridine diphosphokinase [Candidatus Micrarchaeota archaeon]
MPYVFLGLGSNVGDRFAHLQAAVDSLSDAFAVFAVSPVYETAPKYESDQPQFLNAVAKVYTEKSVSDVIAAVEQTEKNLGKHKKPTTGGKGPRTIDIDVLFMGGEVFDQNGWHVPHPAIDERAFVLAPLNDIAPAFRHPVLQKSMAEMWAAIPSEEKKSVTKTDLKLTAVSSSVVPIASVDQAEQLIREVGVDDVYSVKSMAQKTVTKVIRLKSVRATMANILKQEMLSLGGDAAVHKDAVSCKVDKTDVLLIGTLKQLRQLVSKLRVQVAEAQQIAYAVDGALRETS